jgi:anaerobic ribonucleoside-triphosphate reductase activating protein
MTPDSQDLNAGFNVGINDMTELILNTNNIEGITITGGEPFLQAKELLDMIKQIKEKKDLGIIIYTGFTFEQLKNKDDEYTNKLLSKTDILIDGLYDDSLNDGVSLRGSSNQNIYQLTSRYSNVFDKYYKNKTREIELHMTDENMMVAGIPKRDLMLNFRS